MQHHMFLVCCSGAMSNQKLGDCSVCLSLQDAYSRPQGGINRSSGRRGGEGWKEEKGTFCSDPNEVRWARVFEEHCQRHNGPEG